MAIKQEPLVYFCFFNGFSFLLVQGLLSLVVDMNFVSPAGEAPPPSSSLNLTSCTFSEEFGNPN